MSLIVGLERDLPVDLAPGTSTVVFCIGSCRHAEEQIDRLEIAVNGVRNSVAAFGMPRPDLGGGAGPDGWHSGFWATIPVTAPATEGTITLELMARLADGRECRAGLGQIRVATAAPAAVPAAVEPARPGAETIAVCMATYEPDMDLFAAQIESLRAQTDDRWICLISDDCSSPERLAQIEALIGADRRFVISRSPARLGFYRNFERALQMVPDTARLVALCDQDDRWHPDKLTTLRDGLGDAILIYSDLRLVDAQGTVLRSTLWEGRSNNFEDLVSVLVANTITGAAMLFRRELLELALPFPDTPGFQFHDTWLAVIALAAGRVAYIDRPLYDYVQHPGAVFGDVTHGTRAPQPGPLAGLLAWLRDGGHVTAWRAAYFYGYLAREAQAKAALARCGPRLSTPKRRALERFVACDRSPAALLWLTARPARALLGHTETLGSEFGLARGVAWKALAVAAAGHPRLSFGPLADASVPPPQMFSQKRLRRWRARV